MNNHTIQKLNQLNQHFYSQIAEEFSQTRQMPWKGWENLLEYLKKLPAKSRVLDLGCGNGRFGQFLATHFPEKDFFYLGTDNNAQLLKIAQQQLSATHLQTQFVECDIIESLMKSTFLEEEKPFDVIVLFGVIHHIPSFALRQKCIQVLTKKLTPSGLLIFSTWQFDRDTSLMQRQKFSDELSFDQAELEPHDYFLSWGKEETVTRYCHLTKLEEVHKIVDRLPLNLLTHFSADGKEGNLNEYYVWDIKFEE
jgi:tRNA (uracil-5-)-methyltransferase TRM9